MRPLAIAVLIPILCTSCANTGTAEMVVAHSKQEQAIANIRRWHHEIVNELTDELRDAYWKHLTSIFNAEIAKKTVNGQVPATEVTRVSALRDEQWAKITAEVEAARAKYLDHPDFRSMERLSRAMAMWLATADATSRRVQEALDLFGVTPSQPEGGTR